MRIFSSLLLAALAFTFASCTDEHPISNSESDGDHSTELGLKNQNPDHRFAEDQRHSKHDDNKNDSSHGDHGSRHDSSSHDRTSPGQHSEHAAEQSEDRDAPHKNDHDEHGKHRSRDHVAGSHSGDHAHTNSEQHDNAHPSPTDVAHRDRPRDRPAEVSLTLEVEPDETEGLPADQIFSRRILPIMRSEKKSSCTECHFAGVELQDYLHEDQATTFAALRDEGLIDEKNPDKSKLLTFIARRPRQENELLAKVRRNEYQAFRTWIRAAVKDPQLLKAPATKESIGSELPVEVIRHARKDRVLSSFVDNVWSQIGRCINCHSPERNQRQVKKFGDRVSWIVPRNPAATLQMLVDGGNVDTVDPELSPMLLKPSGLDEHGGGPKFFPGGHTYKQFLNFLEDYAAVTNGEYKTAKDLPPASSEVVRLGRQHLRIVNVPADLKTKPLRVDIYRWNKQQRRWSVERWATAYNPIPTKAPHWQSMISVTAPKDSPRAATIRREPLLPAGAYLAKVYVDRNGNVKNANYEMTGGELIGQVEITGQWRPGYQPPKIIQYPRLNSP
ncbi:MAG: hypothetical protein IH991_03365 [Planctomycetes bacterium]|nr:hypothetical protein [Planctomycetota bacterium]